MGTPVYHVEGLTTQKEKNHLGMFLWFDVGMVEVLQFEESYRNRKHQLCVSSQVSYVAVQRDVFLCRTCLADGERHSQDGVGSELSCFTGSQVFVSKNHFVIRVSYQNVSNLGI